MRPSLHRVTAITPRYKTDEIDVGVSGPPRTRPCPPSVASRKPNALRDVPVDLALTLESGLGFGGIWATKQSRGCGWLLASEHVSSWPMFGASTFGERVWPRYPRSPDGRADHRQAREYVDDGVLNPESRWQLSVA